MAIKRITISNFKSFEHLEIDLGNFNILIGANASGKSNFIDIFDFLRNLSILGLDNAISLQGGPEYLINMKIGSSKDFILEVTLERDYRKLIEGTKGKKGIGFKVHEIIYRFILKLAKNGAGVSILEEKLIQKFFLFSLKKANANYEEKEKLWEGEIVVSSINGKPTVEHLSLPDDLGIEKDQLFPRILTSKKLHPKTLLVELPLFVPPLFSDISIYDFDPKLCQGAAPITGKAELEENGKNLAIVLKNIMENKGKKRSFFNLLGDVLPFVKDMDVERFVDKSLLFKFKEVYAPNVYLPATFMSDGTINITALIVALYFEENPLIIIEEPERNLHPFLISKVVQMLKDASENKQIIVTTHNPEMLKYANLGDILLLSRDKKGFSTIFRPCEKAAIKTFLKNEIGIEELYTQNLLEI